MGPLPTRLARRGTALPRNPLKFGAIGWGREPMRIRENEGGGLSPLPGDVEDVLLRKQKGVRNNPLPLYMSGNPQLGKLGASTGG